MALRGRSLGGVVMDEAAFMDEGVWFGVIRPALADKLGWGSSLARRGHSELVHELYLYADEEKATDWKRWTFTTIEGGNVPEEVEAARSQLDPRTFRQEFEASFENLSGLVAVNFSDENIQEVRDIPNARLLCGCDFNIDPFCAVFAVKVDEELHVFDEFHLTGGVTTWDFCDAVIEKYGLERRIVMCPDPPGAARKTAGVGVTDHAIMRKAGFTVRTPKSPWKVRDKITCVNTGLHDANGVRRIKIHPRCRELIKSLRTLVYEQDTGLPNKKLGVDHMFDALGYLCLMEFNLARPNKVGQSAFKIYGSAHR